MNAKRKKETIKRIDMLEEKCKEDFEKWYLWVYLDLENVSTIDQQMRLLDFKQKRPSEQYGVFVDFFGSTENKMLVEYSIYDHRIRIIDFDHDVEEQIHVFDMTYEFPDSKDLKSDYENEAIKQASKLYNERL